MMIAAVGIVTDQVVLIIGAMVVGPEFGPIAGLCVALISRRGRLAARSGIALAVGFPLAITCVYVATLIFKATDLTPDDFRSGQHQVAELIASPDVFSVIVAVCAGAAGMLSLSTAKSGALIGVLISVTTVPAAANIGVAAAYTEWSEWRGAMLQLTLNLTAILLAGVATLFVQRLVYVRRRRAHLHDSAREAAGLPLGRSRHVGGATYGRATDEGGAPR
jgi:uncharacterized hydrophobic protein (TIGR00271 family)